MGYATTFYAVDLEALQSAVGSGDRDLVERALSAGRQEVPAIDPNQGPRLLVTRDSQVFLNGRAVNLEELGTALREPRWAGTNVYWYHERGQKSGAWREPGSFMRTLQEALAGTRVAGVLGCASEAELRTGWQDEDELSEQAALAELVAGTFTSADGAYGYALERLCAVLGTRLGVIEGKGRLAALRLDSPLSRTRLPVALPEWADFPYVSSLTAEEVRREVERLAGMDLSFPRSAAIEGDRETYLRLLRAAAEQERAVVTFYY